MTFREIWYAITTPHIMETTDPFQLSMREIGWAVDDFKMSVGEYLMPAFRDFGVTVKEAIAALEGLGRVWKL